MNETPILAAHDLVHDYSGGIRALDGMSLTVRRNCRLAVLGANGSGKTTLFLHLNGSLVPQAGRVERDGQPTAYHRRALLDWRSAVGLVLQDPDDQLFAATVAEDVSFGPLNLELSHAEVRARVAEALTALAIDSLADRPTHMLSHGQKRRVVLAGVLAMRPRVILLDEPTAGLDAQGTKQLLACLDGLNRAGAALVFSTHDLDLAYAWADEVAVLAGGRCLAQGPTAEILADAGLLAQAGLRPPVVLEVARILGFTARSGDELLDQLRAAQPSPCACVKKG